MPVYLENVLLQYTNQLQIFIWFLPQSHWPSEVLLLRWLVDIGWLIWSSVRWRWLRHWSSGIWGASLLVRGWRGLVIIFVIFTSLLCSSLKLRVEFESIQTIFFLRIPVGFRFEISDYILSLHTSLIGSPVRIELEEKLQHKCSF